LLPPRTHRPLGKNGQHARQLVKPGLRTARASDRDLRALAAIVSEDRTDLPDGEGCRPSAGPDPLRCLSVDGWDTGRQMCWFSQEIQDLEAGRKRGALVSAEITDEEDRVGGDEAA
jgi:hypothetical protein